MAERAEVALSALDLIAAERQRGGPTRPWGAMIDYLAQQQASAPAPAPVGEDAPDPATCCPACGRKLWTACAENGGWAFTCHAPGCRHYWSAPAPDADGWPAGYDPNALLDPQDRAPDADGAAGVGRGMGGLMFGAEPAMRCATHGAQRFRWLEGDWRCQVCGEPPAGPVDVYALMDQRDALAAQARAAEALGDEVKHWRGLVMPFIEWAQSNDVLDAGEWAGHSVFDGVRTEYDRLRARLAEAERERLEQARLNGMGSEREARLLARVEEAERRAAAAVTPRPESEWHEDVGPVLWWRFPVSEPPYAGTPLDSDWPGYHTHWTPITVPVLATPAGGPEGGRDA